MLAINNHILGSIGNKAYKQSWLHLEVSILPGCHALIASTVWQAVTEGSVTLIKMNHYRATY